MSNVYTVQITDTNILSKLPDTSILQIIHTDNITADDVKRFFDSYVNRKKIQYILEFGLDEDVRKELLQKLKEAFLANQPKDANIQQISDSEIIVDGKVYFLEIAPTGNLVFAHQKFNEVFFSEEVLKYVFGINDIKFEDALFKTPAFWDELLSRNDVYQKFKEDEPEKFVRAYQTSEVALVKIALKEAQLEIYDSYETIKELAQNDLIVGTLRDNDNSNSVLNDSYYGHLLKLENVFEVDSLESFESMKEEDYKDKLGKYKEAVDAVTSIKLATKEIDNNFQTKRVFTLISLSDALLGAAIGKEVHSKIKFSLTQLLNTDSLTNERNAALSKENVLKIVAQSGIVFLGENPTKYTESISAISGLEVKPFVKSTDNKVEIFDISDNFELKRYDVVFPDNTSKTFDVNGSKLKDRVIQAFLIKKVSNYEAGYIGFDRKPDFTEQSLKASYNEVTKVLASYGNYHNDHFVLIDKEGVIFDNKYYTEERVKVDRNSNVNITDNIVVFDADKIMVLGDVENAQDLEINKTITNNAKDIKSIFTDGSKVYAILNDGSVKLITKENLTDTGILDEYKTQDSDGNVTYSLKDNGVNKAITILGVTFFLDNKNNLVYKDGDNIVVIPDIKNISQSGEGLLVTPLKDDPYLKVFYNNKIRDYDFLHNRNR